MQKPFHLLIAHIVGSYAAMAVYTLVVAIVRHSGVFPSGLYDVTALAPILLPFWASTTPGNRFAMDAGPYGRSLLLSVYVLGFLLAARRLRYERVRDEREEHGLCAKCGYDLRATPGRCPECGTEQSS
jgi:hypothetical protein